MVSSITPSTTGAATLGVDTRLARGASQLSPRREDAAQGDRVELTPASISAARESVRAGIAQVHEALAAGHDAQALLVKIQGLARNGGSQADLSAALSGYAERLGAVASRASVVTGADIVVQAEPGAAPVLVGGVDLSLGGEVISVAADAQIDDAGLAQAAQKSLETLQDAMSKLMESARALEAHQGFLGAAERVASVRDMDADGARLLALQVRQGLESAGAGPIANADPQAVLSLFRA
ncbi:MAG: hypothetical protein AB7O98_09370 [Hyphomonadaceae bacterium]